MSDEPLVPEAPEPAGPDWSAFEQAGITPDNFQQVQEAMGVYRDLNNLDTRHQRLQQLVRPDIDGQFLRQMVEPQQEYDPWGHLRGDEQPYEDHQYYQPEPQSFDPAMLPDMLNPVLEANNQQVVASVFQQLNQMAADQHVKDTANQAIQSAGLPPSLAGLVEQQVRQAQQMNPTRQAGDVAREAVATLQREIMQFQAQPPANAAPQGQVPGGPIPGVQRPKTIEEALEYGRHGLNP